MSDKATALPKGWATTSLSAVSDINPRMASGALSDDAEVTFLPMKAVSAESGKFDASTVKTYGEVKKGYTAFADGDILFAKITPCMENGKVAVVHGLKNGIGCGSTEFHVIRLAQDLPRKFVFLHLVREQFRKEARLNMTGSAGQLRVPQSYLEESQLLLPPLPEQHRIVAKIEELFSDLDAGVEALKKCQAILKRYRQSVLKAAFEGKLTAEWRKKNKGKLEPASVLLDRIRQERQKQAGGKKVKELPPVDTSELPELPEGWAWAKMEAIGPVQLGRQRSPKNRSKDYATPYIRAANITEAGLDLTEVLDMEFTPDERKRFTLSVGDLVVSEASGSPDQVGKPAVWRNEIPGCCFQNTVIRLRPSLDSVYLLWVLRSFYFTGIFARTAGGVGINHLSAGKFSTIPVPVAPVPEQAQIVAEIDRRFSLADQVETILASSLKQAGRLRQSILKRAFEGRLVPQNPKDEPAEKLLERIKAERIAAAEEHEANCRRRKRT